MAKEPNKRPTTPATLGADPQQVDPGSQETAASAESGEEKRLRQNLPPPVCPYHRVECRSNRSDPLFTRYYCPTAGCTYSAKVARPVIDQVLRRQEAREDFSAR